MIDEYSTCNACCLDAGFTRRLRRWFAPVGSMLVGAFLSFLTAVWFMVAWSTSLVECKHAQNKRLTDFRKTWAGFAARCMNVDAAQITNITKRRMDAKAKKEDTSHPHILKSMAWAARTPLPLSMSPVVLEPFAFQRLETE